MNRYRTSRSDIASFRRVYRDTGTAALEFAQSLKTLTLLLVLIPVHLLLWLWLPELSEPEHTARERRAQELADADF